MEDFFGKKAQKYEEKIKKIFSFDFNLLGTYVKEVKELSDIFLKRKISPQYFSEQKFLRAYSFFYFHQNYYKIIYLLSLLKKAFEKREKIVALDFGGGPGNSTLALRDFFEFIDTNYKIFYFDKQSPSYEFFRELDSDNRIERVENYDFREKIDLFLFSYTLKEIGGAYKSIISKIMNIASKNSFIIFADAPDPQVLRSLESIRKIGLKENFKSVFPCPASGNCPVLKLKKDKEKSCFSQINWNPPELVQIINSKLFFRIKYLKFSSLILSNYYEREDYFFSISPYLKEKGRGRVYFCTSDGRIEVVLMKKSESEKNRVFKEMLRGDMVKISSYKLSKENLIKLEKDTEVCFLSSPLKIFS